MRNGRRRRRLLSARARGILACAAMRARRGVRALVCRFAAMTACAHCNDRRLEAATKATVRQAFANNNTATAADEAQAAVSAAADHARLKSLVHARATLLAKIPST